MCKNDELGTTHEEEEGEVAMVKKGTWGRKEVEQADEMARRT